MLMKNTRSGSATSGIGLVGLWTVLATVFHYAEFGAFKDWPVIAWPWHWSCLCIAIWWIAIFVSITIGIILYYAIKLKKYKRGAAESDNRMKITRLLCSGQIDEAKSLAKELWPNGIPANIQRCIEENEKRSRE